MLLDDPSPSVHAALAPALAGAPGAWSVRNPVLADDPSQIIVLAVACPLWLCRSATTAVAR